MKENVKQFVIDYLEREYKLPEDCDFNTFNFIKSGYVDSLGAVKFMATLEDEYGFEFTDDELMDESNQILGNLIKLIEKKI